MNMMSAKDKKKGPLVPRLRFPEFQNAGEWKEKQLGACLGYQQPTAYLVSDTNYNSSFVTPVLTAGKTFILGYTNERHGIFSEGLPVIIFDDFTTATQFVDFPFKAKSSAMKILEAKKGASIKFMYEVLQTISYCTETHERHWISKFAPMPIKIPQLREQQKVADCLSSLDERIAAETNKLDALKAHKKGLLKQLFPAEGETLPALRFPKFRNAGEWKKADFGNIAKFLSGGTPSKDVCDYWGGDIPWISASSMHNIKIEKSDCNITKLAVSNGARIAPKGTLLLLVRGSMLHKRILLGISEIDVSFNQDVKALVLNDDITELYLMYFLMASESKLLATVVQTGIGAGKLDTDDLNNFPIMMPSPTEQQRISNCLSSLDELITAQTQKIDLLKEHKKGLMQQLFPRIDEVRA